MRQAFWYIVYYTSRFIVRLGCIVEDYASVKYYNQVNKE